MTDDLKTVLDEAATITSGARLTHYGHPTDNHGCTASLWTGYVRRRFEKFLELVPEDLRKPLLLAVGQFELDARDVCWLNILQKASRDANLPVRDNLVDACGYARNAEMLEDRKPDLESSRKQGESEAA